MLYITHNFNEFNNDKVGVFVRNTDDNTVALYTIAMLESALNRGIYIGGLDSLNPLKVRKANRCPFLYDYCIANGLDFANEIDDDTDAKKVTIGTKGYVNWQCSKGHKWRARIDSRIRYNQGCPHCNREMGIGTSFSEQRYFYYLKKYINDLDNRVVLDNRYEFDIYSKSLNLAIEYDGGYHTEKVLNKDIEKTTFAKSIGLKLIRIRARGSFKYDFDCLCYDEEKLGYVFIIKDILRLLGFDYLSFESDLDEINTIYKKYKKVNKNSVLYTKPEILKTYAYDLNGDIDLDIVSKSSNIEAYWYCAICGRPYKRSFHQLNKGFDTCLDCKDLKMLLSRIEKYGNALSEDFPDLVQWYSEYNKYPFYVLQKSSNQKILFKCPKCGYEFIKRPCDLVKKDSLRCENCYNIVRR